MISTITNKENEEDNIDSEHQIYELDNELYYVDKSDGSIYHIDLKKEKNNIENSTIIEQDVSENEKEDLDNNETKEIDVSNLNINKKDAIKNEKIEKGGCDMDFEKNETSETETDSTEPELTEDQKLWMQQAFKPEHKGLLHRKLGIAEDKDIPISLINKKITTLRAKGEGKDKKLSSEDLKLLRELIAARNAKKISASKKKSKDFFEDMLDIIFYLTEDYEMKETSETKPDGSEAMKERRITQCMEETGKSRKDCTEEVRKKMHDKGAEAVNPEDMNNKPEEEEEEEEEEEKKTNNKDTVEICSKEYDFLKKQSEELKVLKEEKEKIENEFASFKEDFLRFKKKIDDKETIEKEDKRQEVIKRISHDFDIPEDEMKDDTIEELEKFEKRLELALKRDMEEEEKETFGEEEDFKEMGDRIHKRYFLEV